MPSGNFKWVDLGDYICESDSKVSLNQFPNEMYKISGVNNTLGVFEAYEASGNEFNQSYKKVFTNDFVYNPYRINVGSIGIVPEELNASYVSPAYIVFRIVENAPIDLIFFSLVMRSEWFNPILRAATAGSVRQNLTVPLLKKLQFPLASIEIQHAIVTRWREARDRIDAAKVALDDLITELDEKLWRIYREHALRDILSARSFALGFGEIGAWDLKSSRAAAFAITCPSFREMGEFVEESTELVRPNAQPDKLWPLYGVNNKEGVFLSAMQEGKDFNAPYKQVREGWFFHNPTRCNVGSLGIVPAVPDDAITSPEYQVWKLKEDSELLGGFVSLMIRTSFFLALVQFNRVGGVKERMYVENLRSIRIPVLSADEQLDFSRRRDEALQALKATATLEVEAKAAIEKMILGE